MALNFYYNFKKFKIFVMLNENSLYLLAFEVHEMLNRKQASGMPGLVFLVIKEIYNG